MIRNTLQTAVLGYSLQSAIGLTIAFLSWRSSLLVFFFGIMMLSFGIISIFKDVIQVLINRVAFLNGMAIHFIAGYIITTWGTWSLRPDILTKWWYYFFLVIIILIAIRAQITWGIIRNIYKSLKFGEKEQQWKELIQNSIIIQYYYRSGKFAYISERLLAKLRKTVRTVQRSFKGTTMISLPYYKLENLNENNKIDLLSIISIWFIVSDNAKKYSPTEWESLFPGPIIKVCEDDSDEIQSKSVIDRIEKEVKEKNGWLSESISDARDKSLLAEMARRVFNYSRISKIEHNLPYSIQLIPTLMNKEGLSPLADSLLRVKSSQEVVEQYLGIMDCYEVLIKISVIAMLSSLNSNNSETLEMRNSLDRPSLGHWLSLLRDLSQKSYHEKGISLISQFWNSKLSQKSSHMTIIDSTAGLGLEYHGRVPRTHIQWLEWLTWLRNATKGHGVISENHADTLFCQLYEGFLTILKECPSISFAYLQDKENKARFIGGKRWREYSNSMMINENSTELELVLQNTEPLNVEPFIIYKNKNILLWNSIKGPNIEYIDYSSGETVRINKEF